MTNTIERKHSLFTTRKMVLTAMMSAVAIVIYYLDFPVPFMPGFIKLDLSNVISLVAGFSMGPVAGVTVCLIKNLVHLVIKGFGTTMGIGDIFDFVTSAVFALTAGLIYLKNKTRKGAVISCLIGVVVFTLISLPLNYFIVYPIYFKAYGGEQAILGAYKAIRPETDSIFEALCIFNLPFTFVKGVLCALVTMVIYKPLSPIIKGG
ncbi:MAG TPA: ECF transporter S component, partial [Ruminococcus sp.]|nr:ECF transporter S component [Ruminococcus sp.]